MKKIIFGLTSVILFASCKGLPKETLTTDNRDFQVQLLFEVDGCKVYRFWDGGECRYFTSCNGSVNYTSGKNDTQKEIQTVVK